MFDEVQLELYYKKKITKIIVKIIVIQQKICYLMACCVTNKTDLITDMIS